VFFNVRFLDIHSARIKTVRSGSDGAVVWLNVEVVQDVARSKLVNTSQRLVTICRSTQRTSHKTPTKLSVLVNLQMSASYKHTRFSVTFKWALEAHDIY
jgi:hypothetical protein